MTAPKPVYIPKKETSPRPAEPTTQEPGGLDNPADIDSDV